MLSVKRFSGILNTDDQNSDILPNQHTHGRNIRFTGGAVGLTAENVKGTVLVNNGDLPNGTNECIGAFFDSVKQRIIWFNWNQYGNNGIYSYSVQTGSVTQIFRCGVNSATDILNFSLDYPVHSAAIVYRTTGDGDLLYWTDGYNRPKYINLDTVATLSPFTADMLNAAKNAPLSPPTFPVVANTNGVFGYYSDATVNSNLVKNKQFRFAYRWVYENGEKSTFSPTSIVPLPYVNNPELQVNETTNNYIKVIVYSPETDDFTGIELFGQEWNGTAFGDFFLIDSLDKDDYNILPDSSYTYNFYNNGSYVFIDPQESDLYFSWLPDKANTLELLNGNVLVYGGITDGYNQLTRSDVDVTITSSLVSLDPILATIPNNCPVFRWGSTERFGLVYFDKRGKTNGVVSFVTDSTIDTTDFSVTTPNYPGQTNVAIITVPQIDATINHLPPSWAETYQWVRLKSTPKFLQWVTMDYQTDNEYLYLGIQNLVEMNGRGGFLPSYEFSPGDRVRILGKVNGDNDTTVFSEIKDYPILDVVEKQMTSPASDGRFLKIPKPSSFPTPGYSAVMFIETYTPIPRLPDNQQLFYEWGEKYNIYELGGVRYHEGQNQNQTGSQPATFSWTNGDVYIKRRGYFVAVPIENNLVYSFLDMMDANFDDYVTSAGNANSRAWVIDENAKEEYNPVLVRWGGKYQAGTNINQLNIFRPSDFDEVDRGKGDIRRFKVRDRIMRVFQDRGVGQYGIYARFIQNNEGVSDLVTTNEIITTNNIQYYQGMFGLGGYPTNLCSSPIADYFTDVITGRGIRLAADGLTDLGVLYKGQFYFPQLVTPYNKTLTRSNGSKAKVMAFFDTFDNDFHTILQAGTGGGVTSDGYHFAFNEPRNGYVCDQYDYNPDWAVSANDTIFSWQNGFFYKHTNTSNPVTFYGVKYPVEITLVFNDNLLEKKSWQAISQVANTIWAAPLMYTNVMSYGTQRQETNLLEAEFTLLEGMPSSAIKRDANSRGGKINGNFMKGNYLSVKLQKANATNLVTLNEIAVRLSDSPKTDQ